MSGPGRRHRIWYRATAQAQSSCLPRDRARCSRRHIVTPSRDLPPVRPKQAVLAPFCMTRPSTSQKSPEHPRLSKRMSELGLCSRREADRWITSGWVKVDGQVVDTLGVRVSPEARIEIDPAAREHQSEQVTILLHKPVGYVSGQAEDGYE